jgi:hypothetical protein
MKDYPKANVPKNRLRPLPAASGSEA